MPIVPIESNQLPVHGGPQDRGSADAYYHREYDPHWYPSGTGKGNRIEISRMTHAQIEEYKYGYENEIERKDYG
jgi:hypothetical protein